MPKKAKAKLKPAKPSAAQKKVRDTFKKIADTAKRIRKEGESMASATSRAWAMYRNS